MSSCGTDSPLLESAAGYANAVFDFVADVPETEQSKEGLVSDYNSSCGSLKASQSTRKWHRLGLKRLPSPCSNVSNLADFGSNKSNYKKLRRIQWPYSSSSPLALETRTSRAPVNLQADHCRRRAKTFTARSNPSPSLMTPAQVSALAARASLRETDVTLRDEAVLRRYISTNTSRLAESHRELKQVSFERDALLGEIQRRHLRRGGGTGRFMNFDVSSLPEQNFSVSSESQAESSTPLMTLRFHEDLDFARNSDSRSSKSEASGVFCYDDEGGGSIHTPSTLRHALDIIRRLRLKNLSLRARLMQNAMSESRLRTRLMRSELQRAERERTWRHRLSAMFSEAQLNVLRQRWFTAGLLDVDSAWEWLPRADWQRPGWTLHDYRMTIELRANCTARGFNYLLGPLGYPLPSMFATRSAAHCSKYPQVEALYRQLCTHKQISFERGDESGLEVELADEYDPEVAARTRQLQKEAEMVLLHDEVARRSAEVVEGASLVDVVQWSGVQCSPHRLPPPPPPVPPHRRDVWPQRTASVDGIEELVTSGKRSLISPEDTSQMSDHTSDNVHSTARFPPRPHCTLSVSGNRSRGVRATTPEELSACVSPLYSEEADVEVVTDAAAMSASDGICSEAVVVNSNDDDGISLAWTCGHTVSSSSATSPSTTIVSQSLLRSSGDSSKWSHSAF